MTISADESRFLWAVRQQESGGNYHSTNSIGAMGAYQMLSSNLASWEKEAGLPIETGTKFLDDKNEQDQLAVYKLGGYYNKYGDRGAAAMWYSGQPDPTKTYGNPPVSQYVSEVVAREKQAPANGIGADSGTASIPSTGGTVQQSSAFDPLSLMGISNPKDTFERVGLVILGVLFMLVAVMRFTDWGQSVLRKSETVAKIAMV